MGDGRRGGRLPRPAPAAERPGTGGVSRRRPLVPAPAPGRWGSDPLHPGAGGACRPRGVHRNLRLVPRRRRASAPPERIVPTCGASTSVVPELLHAGGATLPRLVIHGDFGPASVVLDGARPGFPADGLAGFDRSPLRRPGARPGRGTQDLRPGAAGGFDLDRCADIMAAYDEVDRLSPAEVEALPIILRVERLVRVFRLTSGRNSKRAPPARRRTRLVEAINSEADRLRWLEAHEPRLRRGARLVVGRVSNSSTAGVWGTGDPKAGENNHANGSGAAHHE